MNFLGDNRTFIAFMNVVVKQVDATKYNKWFTSWEFKLEDLVLRGVNVGGKNFEYRKFTTNWEVP